MPQLLTMAFCKKYWKMISAESSQFLPDDRNDHGTEQNWTDIWLEHILFITYFSLILWTAMWFMNKLWKLIMTKRVKQLIFQPNWLQHNYLQAVTSSRDSYLYPALLIFQLLFFNLISSVSLFLLHAFVQVFHLQGPFSVKISLLFFVLYFLLYPSSFLSSSSLTRFSSLSCLLFVDSFFFFFFFFCCCCCSSYYYLFLSFFFKWKRDGLLFIQM